MPGMPKIDYAKSPFLVIWETTQACDLSCTHCRASAQPLRDKRELSTAEGKNLLDQAHAMGTPIFILSGGDPLKREDLCELIEHGAGLGLRMATIPAATPMLTEDVVRRLKESGCSQMALSLDFPTAERHDAFRGVPGAYAKTMQAVEWAHRYKMPLQINTTLSYESIPHLDEMAKLVTSFGIVFWEVFFLVPTGRGTALKSLTPSMCEEVFAKLYDIQKVSRFLVKVTEAPHYRRHVAQREWAEQGQKHARGDKVNGLPSQLIRTEGPGHTIGLATQGVNSGNGFLFVSHTGEIFPSGFLPISAGDVRKDKIADVYRTSELFLALRSPEKFKGICGVCEFGRICGGSRSRAFALTGDHLESDPWCAYRPAGARTETAPA